MLEGKNWDKMFDPPNEHEVDACLECHNGGDHDEVLYWKDLCYWCNDRAWGEEEVMEETTEHIPEEVIFTGSPEERVWAAGKIARRVRLKDVPEYIEALFDASSEIRRASGKEEKITYYFNLGKSDQPFAVWSK